MKWRKGSDDKPIKPWHIERQQRNETTSNGLVRTSGVVVLTLLGDETSSSLEIELSDHEARLLAHDLLSTAP